ncbi:hypothetical protein [Streptomyces sp. NPDC049879]|uniref:hypothetical protein n=1 Tax=Streptomyces sp. NPDC049879 TaxID=3365598 RepID=UPI0037A0D65A
MRLDQWRTLPARHPARWTADAVSGVSTAWVIARAVVRRPIASARVMQQVARLAARHQPDELTHAVSEAARLHVPDQPVYEARFHVHQPSRTCDLQNVAFRHGRHHTDVTRITLGGNPVALGGSAGPDTRQALAASRERVALALAALPIGPGIAVITVPCRRRDT